jgi:hypothetical protein
MRKPDRDIEAYRGLMEVPSTYDEGFSWSALLGAVFIAVVMIPGAIYMGLMQGDGVGSAAQWVMVLIFVEIAKRMNQSMKKAQIFILFYMTGAAMAMPFAGLLWNQYFVRSEALIGQGLADQVPAWVAPPDSRVLAQRNFFLAAWWPALGLVLFTQIMSRLDNAILGYGLFKVASDIEKLPFPMAPIGAQGIAALAEDLEETDKKPRSGRWRVFAIGGAIGLVFGFLYLGIPTLSEAVLHTSIRLFPIPFSDWTGRTAGVLPAVATGFSYHLGSFVMGMIIPFWAVVGGMVGVIVTCVLNPILHHARVLVSWQPGDSTVETLFKNRVDFYFSFGIGISLAIAAIGMGAIARGIRERKRHREAASAVRIPRDRGDISFPVVGVVYAVSTLLYIVVSGWLIDWHKGVMIVLVVYGFLYTPVISYATARLEGMIGQAVSIPFVREAGLLLSGYQGLACWFLPMPIHNYGAATVFYRQAELTGTKFTSIWKTEALLVPFVLICSVLYAQLIWSMGDVPSSAYPFAERMWDLNARNQVLLYSATAGGYSQFMDALKPLVIGTGFAAAMAMFFVLRAFAAPAFLLFGAIRGLDQTMPHALVTEFLGALFARFYLEKRFGSDAWRKAAPVLGAGFGCGMGLIGMFCVGVKFMKTAVFQMPY